MAKLTKRRKLINESIKHGELYSADDAFKLLKELSSKKFSETIDVAVNLGIDPKKSDQVVRGATTLPNGSGKAIRVCVFAQVGMDDLSAEISKGRSDFDVVIASPDSMRIVGTLGKVLGPRGLMPNPKSGTVTKDVGQAVKNAKAGQVRYRADKNGIIHGGIGTTKFKEVELKQNQEAVLGDLVKSKPSTAKGIYIKKITVSSTMGPGLIVDQASLGL